MRCITILFTDVIDPLLGQIVNRGALDGNETSIGGSLIVGDDESHVIDPVLDEGMKSVLLTAI